LTNKDLYRAVASSSLVKDSFGEVSQPVLCWLACT